MTRPEAEMVVARNALAEVYPGWGLMGTEARDKLASQLLEGFYTVTPGRSGKFLDYARQWAAEQVQLPHRARHRYVPADPTAQAREGDELVSVLSPDAHLVIDSTHNIVLRTPERRITIGNVRNWQAKIDQARAMQVIMSDQAEEARRENVANWLRDRSLASMALRRVNPARFKGMSDVELARLVTEFVHDFEGSHTQLPLDEYAARWEEGHR